MATTQTCAECGHESAPGQTFCGSCGQPLLRACPSCGEDNPSGFRFCGACGSEIAPREPVAAALEGERRWVTVLFGDLAGFTRMSEATDPEDLRLMIDKCTGKMAEIVERHGGWVDKVIGDELMAVFGAPTAHEDDAERAVSAGLELQRYAADNAAELAGLALRVGLESGEVMYAPVGPRDDRRLTVIGDVVNTASRLQAAAPEGAVLIGHRTKEACGDAIRCEALDPIEIKGKETPHRVWLATEAVSSPDSETAPTGPMVGRQPELELLRSAWGRVTSLSQPELVSLLGPAGIGKTRLCQELLRQVEDGGGRAAIGRSLPYGESAGYGGFARMIRSLAGIVSTDTPGQAREKLRRRVEAMDDLPAPATTLEHVSLLAGFAGETVEKRSMLFASARGFVEAVAREEPTLFVFEDIHWADATLLDLIEWMAAHVREVPAMFLTLARGDLLDERPHWGGGLPCHTGISLEPLAPEISRRLAVRLLPGHSDLDDAAERIEQAAGGNPLFIEELAAATVEGAAGSAHELPVAIRGTIAARLDALPIQERGLILDASVAGNVFDRRMLECLAGEEVAVAVAKALDDLEFRDLIRRRRGSSAPGGEQYTFKHGLIREVAYGTLPRAARRQRHAMVAEFLEDADRSGRDAEAMLAYHWREAGDSERAVEHLLSAAELAGRGWAKGEAVAMYNQALELIPEDEQKLRREVELKRALDYAAFTHIEDARNAQAIGGAGGGGRFSR